MKPVIIRSFAATRDFDSLTPVGLFRTLDATETAPFFLLESADDPDDLGQYSYIGLNPLPLNELLSYRTMTEMNRQMSSIHFENESVLPPLGAGIVGYVAYNAVQEFQPVKLTMKSDIPPYTFLLAQRLLVLDHRTHQVSVIENRVNPTAEINGSAVQEQLENWLDELLDSPSLPASEADYTGEPIVFRSSFSKTGYMDSVKRIQEYIRAGDAFQVVLSQQFRAEATIKGFELYRQLRRYNPSSYLSYVRFNGFEALCSSPEMLVRQSSTLLETVPIAGTRPVLNDGKDDERAKDLFADPKERAEHLMLVDLARNDMGRVAVTGTVEVTEYCQLKKHSRVMHLASRVQAIPKPDLGVLGGFMAAFPAGTVSGAPKIRAMEIIDELEPVPRNLYAGSLVILNPKGYLNSCIAIRTILLTETDITIQAGAGIVYDSVPETEYEETLNKAGALFQAVEAYTGGRVTYDLGH